MWTESVFNFYSINDEIRCKKINLRQISAVVSCFNMYVSLQRSISFRNESRTERVVPPPSSSTMKTRVTSSTVSNPSSSTTATRVSTAAALASKRRDSKLWSETFDVRLGATQPLSPKEIKRQEVKICLLLDFVFRYSQNVFAVLSSLWCSLIILLTALFF